VLEQLEWVTGVPCLNFVNTVEPRDEAPPAQREWLETPEHALAWAEQAGVVDGALAGRLRRAARQRPGWAGDQLAALLDRRERLYRLLRAHIEDRPADRADLAAVSAWIGEARGRAELRRDGEGYRFGWPAEVSFDRIGWPVADSAARLLTGPDLRDLGSCSNGPCGWLYLDTSRNHSRRWCSMRVCGNAVKVRRFRDRQRS
jgi:predicted RNA-binding Zn ribbon-like protein